MTLLDRIRTLITGPEPGPLARLSDEEMSYLVEMAYQYHFHRKADPAALAFWPDRFRDGVTLEAFADALRHTDDPRTPTDIEGHDAIGASVKIMGTERSFTRVDWTERLAGLQPIRAIPKMPDRFQHSGTVDVSIVTSVYKAGAFMERFLANITEQTIFDRCELLIVDADSPDGEEDLVARYRTVFPNIIYKRVNYRLGIYDAWNDAIDRARGTFVTNANVDDLRRKDSLERQVELLHSSEADVVYQNFYYALDPALDFDTIARAGFVSDLPAVTRETLLAFNPPHNAPMWRRSLHDDVGLFDTAFKSAGDWEFWLRCLFRKKRFAQTTDAHVAYYLNPDGVSTRVGSRAYEEIHWIRNRYEPRLAFD